MTTATVDANTDNGSVPIAVMGELDLANTSAAREHILATLSGQPKVVSVNLANVTCMDSVGVRVTIHPAVVP
jgi:anti-anti-sigma factor